MEKESELLTTAEIAFKSISQTLAKRWGESRSGKSQRLKNDLQAIHTIILKEEFIEPWYVTIDRIPADQTLIDPIPIPRISMPRIQTARPISPDGCHIFDHSTATIPPGVMEELKSDWKLRDELARIRTEIRESIENSVSQEVKSSAFPTQAKVED